MVPAQAKTGTGITTASHLDVVAGVVAAGEAVAGTEAEGIDVAALAIDPPRYENLLPSNPFPIFATKWVFISGV